MSIVARWETGARNCHIFSLFIFYLFLFFLKVCFHLFPRKKMFLEHILNFYDNICHQKGKMGLCSHNENCYCKFCCNTNVTGAFILYCLDKNILSNMLYKFITFLCENSLLFPESRLYRHDINIFIYIKYSIKEGFDFDTNIQTTTRTN